MGLFDFLTGNKTEKIKDFQARGAVIIDVRTDNELAAGIIPNAVHIDFYRGHDFIAEIQKLDKDKNYYVYCRSGNRSGQACKIMGQLGFKNAYNLIGGMMQWQGEIE